jgi:hypothetical protein
MFPITASGHSEALTGGIQIKNKKRAPNAPLARLLGNEDFVIDLFSELPTTCWFQRVSDTLIAHLWTTRGKMRKIDIRNKNFPELQISLLIQELLERGIIRKENHSYREFYWRKEIGDI